MQPTQEQKAADFLALHEGEAFIIPNPWDAGSAKVLQVLGFKALATTSSGFAFTLGRPDGETTLDEVVDHVRLFDQSTERHRKRSVSPAARPRDRGWKREDLYSRGRTR